MKTTLALTASCFALVIFSADCGGKSAPAPAPSTPTTSASSAAPAASWEDLCKLAEARLARCKITSDMAVTSVKSCASLGCLGDVYDPSAAAVLKTCITADDCDACTKAALASPSTAAKAYAAKAVARGASCSAFGEGNQYPAGELSALYGDKAYSVFNDCIAKPDCADAAGCVSMQTMSNESFITCQQDLGLTVAAGDDHQELLGKPVPEIEGGTSIGKAAVPKIKGNGKFVIIYFWMTDPGTKKPDPSLGGLEKFAKQHKDVVVISVNEDDDQKVAEDSVKKAKLTIPVIWDGTDHKLSDIWGGSPFGSTLTIDKQGVLKFRGPDKFDPKVTAQGLKAL